LRGLKFADLVADSYAKSGGTLDFFSGDTLIKSLRFAETNPAVYGEPHVGRIAGGIGIEIHDARGFNEPLFGPDLPQHIAIAA